MLEGVVIGAGDRGANAYVPYLKRHPEAARIVAVAEPDRERRERFAARHAIPPARCFTDHRGLLGQPKLADFALVATADTLHAEPAIRAMELGYHVLLEKPMAVTESDCRRLVTVADHEGRILQVCHVLRYSPFFEALEGICRSGELGRIITIQHAENIAFWHYAHSYCRGHWRNVAASSPLILAKSCHDLDLLGWLAGAPPRRLTSLARSTELCDANAPADAPQHCIDGCPHASDCPYDAVGMYLDLAPLRDELRRVRHPRLRAAAIRLGLSAYEALRHVPSRWLQEHLLWRGWPVDVITQDVSRAGIEQALRDSRWGRCAYRVGDNDQVSSQSVDVSFENGVAAHFSVHSNSHRECREIRVDGTRGSAVGTFGLAEKRLEVFDHASGRRRSVPIASGLLGHGGGDWRLFEGFLAALRGDAVALTSARESLQSHLMAFAADRAAREGIVLEWHSEAGDTGFHPIPGP